MRYSATPRVGRYTMAHPGLSWFQRWLAEQTLRLGSTRRLSRAAALPEDTVFRLLTEPALVPDAETCVKLATACGVAPDLLLAPFGHDPLTEEPVAGR